MFPDLNPMINLCLLSLSELKAQVSFSDWLSSVRPSVCLSICKLFTFSTSSPEPLGQFQPNFNKKHPWVEGIQFCSNEGSRPFPRGDNRKKVKLNWKYLKIFFSRTTGQFQPNLAKASLGGGDSILIKWRIRTFSKGG